MKRNSIISVALLLLVLSASVPAQEEPKTDEFGGTLQEKASEPELLWELTIVQGNDLIDMPHRFATKGLCIGLGINYVRADHSLNGFVCELEEVT